MYAVQQCLATVLLAALLLYVVLALCLFLFTLCSVWSLLYVLLESLLVEMLQLLWI